MVPVSQRRHVGNSYGPAAVSLLIQCRRAHCGVDPGPRHRFARTATSTGGAPTVSLAVHDLTTKVGHTGAEHAFAKDFDHARRGAHRKYRSDSTRRTTVNAPEPVPHLQHLSACVEAAATHNALYSAAGLSSSFHSLYTVRSIALSGRNFKPRFLVQIDQLPRANYRPADVWRLQR